MIFLVRNNITGLIIRLSFPTTICENII